MKKLLLLLLLAGFVFTGCKNGVGNGEKDSVPYDEPEGEVYTIEGPGTDDDLTIMVKIDNQAITTEEWLQEMSECGDENAYWDLSTGLQYLNDENHSTRLGIPSRYCKKAEKLTILYKKIPNLKSISAGISWNPRFGYSADIDTYSKFGELELLKEINERKYDKIVFTFSFYNIKGTTNGIKYTLKFNDTEIEEKP